ncbi:MAG: STAS domain-containing protein, partial [Leptospiraceae bacterium]|nr:STAS domain-containing protein [Leptospiraceae bacterium]
EFIDSSSIGALIELSNSLVRRGGSLIVHSLNGTTQRIFQATRLTEFVPIAANEAEAMAMVRSSNN